MRELTWQMTGRSVRGSTHVSSGKPNQDAVAAVVLDGASGPAAARVPSVEIGRSLVVAVADGHGSERHPLSDRGSRFAVDEATRVLQSFVEGTHGLSLPDVEARGRAELPGRIVAAWRARVDADEDGVAGAPDSATPLTADGRYLAYGSTLLVAAITDRYLLAVQIGDGDIVAVMPGGGVRHLVPADFSLIANETTSLCQPQAATEFRLGFHVLAGAAPGDLPRLVMLSTDGYANSYANDEAFFTVARDYADLADQHGLASVDDELESWLQATSAEGSGDDITVALVRLVDHPGSGSVEHAVVAPVADVDANAGRADVGALEQTVRQLRSETRRACRRAAVATTCAAVLAVIVAVAVPTAIGRGRRRVDVRPPAPQVAPAPPPPASAAPPPPTGRVVVIPAPTHPPATATSKKGS